MALPVSQGRSENEMSDFSIDRLQLYLACSTATAVLATLSLLLSLFS